MSRYTTEVRFLCETFAGKSKSEGYNSVNEIIASARPVIFDFSYPIFDDNYKAVLETKILKHFYTREIGEETYGLWKLRLDARLNEIMPYYNQLYRSELIDFNPMYASAVTKTHTGSRNDEGTNTLSANGERHNAQSGNSTDTGSTTSTELYSDTPQGGIIHLTDNGYLTNATKNTANTTNNNTNTSNIDTTEATTQNGTTRNTSLDNYTDTVNGYEGVNPSKLLKEFRETFLNIDMRIIEDLEVLFMQIW